MSDMQLIRSYPIPVNEHARGDLAEALSLIERREDPFFDHINHLVKQITGAPIAYLSLIRAEHQTILSIDGFEADILPREAAICAHTIAKKQPLIVPDTHDDVRFADHPIVVNPPHLRFYIGIPVILSSGFCIGTLCAVDVQPRERPSDSQIDQLMSLAKMLARFYEVPIDPNPKHAAQLKRIAMEAQAEFLSLVGHELRTPLNGILGLAEVIEPQDSEQAELLLAIESSGHHLTKIVESILTFTDLNTGDMALEETAIDLFPIIKSSLKTFGKLAQLSDKTLVIGKIADGPRIIGDAAKLELAVGCLLANFIAHGGPEGRVSILRHPSGELNIEVLDNGHGIAPERQTAILQAFAVGAKPTERASDGIGLGLPLTNRVVELHGGELDIIQTKTAMSARIRLPTYRNL